MARVKRVLLALLLLTGCVERKLIIRPDPEGSLVFVDGHEVAPETSGVHVVRYEHYGIRRVVVRKQGHATHAEDVTLDPPWYQVFPIDFFFDVLWPATITDERTVAVKLEPRQDLDGEAAGDRLLERAAEAQREAFAPPKSSE